MADEKKGGKTVYYDGLSGNEPPKYKGESSSLSDLVGETKSKIDGFVQSDAVQDAKEKATIAAKEAKDKTEEKVRELKAKTDEMDPAKKKKLMIGAIIAVILIIIGIIWYRNSYYGYYYYGGNDPVYDYDDYGRYEDNMYCDENYADYNDGYVIDL